MLLKIKKTLDFYTTMCYNNQVAREASRQYLGVAQLVARYLGVVEAARSSRVTQTSVSVRKNTHIFYFCYAKTQPFNCFLNISKIFGKTIDKREDVWYNN